MGEKLDCEHEIGRRIRLRDLHILLTVSQRGSMAQAAAQLGVSQPSVSGVIADLERTLGVPLFERSPRGVKPTVYAREMMDRSVAAFDELKQGIRTIESLADPAAGELWIGSMESVTASVLPPLVHGFMQRYPRVTVHVRRLPAASPELRELSERNLDLVLTRIVSSRPRADDELNLEPLFDDGLVIATGKRNKWARRHAVDLADLANEPWILTPSDCWTSVAIKEAFHDRGLQGPNVCLTTYSVPLRVNLAASGPYITVFPSSVRPLAAYRSIKILPIDLPSCRSTLAIVTLKNRVLNPVAQRFIEHLRACARDSATLFADAFAIGG